METCYICLEKLNINCYNDNKYLKCGCLNRYHAECLYEWAEIQNKCPICRKKINEIEEDNDNNFELEVDDHDIFYNQFVFYFLSITWFFVVFLYLL
jgi:hypothetical protein